MPRFKIAAEHDPTASRARLTLLWFAFLLSVVTYLDRVCISAAAPSIREELHLTPSQMGWIFSAFTFAYAAFEVPSGWLGDRIGPRKVLTRIVLWWSAFTVVTGFAWSFASLVAVRFLFGVGEAGAFPNAAKSFSRWFPVQERGRAHGILFMGTRLGGALAPPLVVLLMAAIGWRRSFWIFGALGIIWAVFWWRWFRDDPSQHPSVSEAELSLIRRGGLAAEPVADRKIQWSYLLRSRNLLYICLMYFCVGYGLYFYLTWLPTYLKEARGFSAQSAGLLQGLTLATGAVASIAGGVLADRLSRKYGLKIGRCALGAVSLAISGIVLAGAALTEDPLASALLVALAAGVADLCLSACWAVCLDVGHEHAGVVTGCMNTLGNLGGAIGPLVMGYAVQWWGSWKIPFLIAAFSYLLGGVFWVLIDPYKPVLPQKGEIIASNPTSSR